MLKRLSMQVFWEIFLGKEGSGRKFLHRVACRGWDLPEKKRTFGTLTFGTLLII